MKVKKNWIELQGWIVLPNARLDLWFRLLTTIRESLNPPSIFNGFVL